MADGLSHLVRTILMQFRRSSSRNKMNCDTRARGLPIYKSHIPSSCIRMGKAKKNATQIESEQWNIHFRSNISGCQNVAFSVRPICVSHEHKYSPKRFKINKYSRLCDSGVVFIQFEVNCSIDHKHTHRSQSTDYYFMLCVCAYCRIDICTIRSIYSVIILKIKSQIHNTARLLLPNNQAQLQTFYTIFAFIRKRWIAVSVCVYAILYLFDESVIYHMNIMYTTMTAARIKQSTLCVFICLHPNEALLIHWICFWIGCARLNYWIYDCLHTIGKIIST